MPHKINILHEEEINELPKQYILEGYKLLKPIPIVLAKNNKEFIAKDRDIGLLVGGSGKTAEEAKNDLCDVIIGQVISFKTEQQCLISYAKKVQDNLEKYISR